MQINLSKFPQAKKTEIPDHFKPELCFLTKNPPESSNWLHEIKFDGYRIIAIINNKKIKLLTRNGLNWTNKLPSIAKALKDFPIKNAIFDGEVVALDKSGLSNFQILQNSFKVFIRKIKKFIV